MGIACHGMGSPQRRMLLCVDCNGIYYGAACVCRRVMLEKIAHGVVMADERATYVVVGWLGGWLLQRAEKKPPHHTPLPLPMTMADRYRCWWAATSTPSRLRGHVHVLVPSVLGLMSDVLTQGMCFELRARWDLSRYDGTAY
jgi:hypothetical protein